MGVAERKKSTGGRRQVRREPYRARAVARLEQHVFKDGGEVIAAYHEPFGGRWVVLASLPLHLIRTIAPLGHLSASHVECLAEQISSAGCALKPLIAFRDQGIYWIAQGQHRIESLRRIGATFAVLLLIGCERWWEDVDPPSVASSRAAVVQRAAF